MRSKMIAITLMAGSLSVAIAMPAAASTTRSDVHRFADGSQVVGAWSALRTGEQGAHFTLHTSELPAGHTITIWWVIFNAPQNCLHATPYSACGPGDLPPFGGDDSAETSVAHAAGHQIGGSGRGHHAGFLATGDDQDALWGPGLTNPTGAEIHLVVRDHGELPPHQRAEGIHSFGPCDPCVDLQFSVHVQ